jgi:[CysO sulfur-carrier protein]-S-L-cysteine hydrolase
MRIRLRSSVLVRLRTTLSRAGIRETGGQLFGEQLAVSDFSVTELTVQARPESFARFVVDVIQAARDAMRFFNRTDHQYQRFNYIGEWHSHPSFAVLPSDIDAQTMRALVRDPGFRGAFAVLMIVRLDGDVVNAGAWVFDPHGTERAISVEMCA